jgi:hypothetical protein
MDEPTLITAMQRLERLERESRPWKALGIGAVAVLGLVVLLGAARSGVSDEVRARRFVLVEQSGKERAELGFLGGSPFLALRDNDENSRFLLTMVEDGSPA